MSITIGAGVNHWHGAAAHSSLTHIAITLNNDEGNAAEWGDAVDDATYQDAHAQLEGTPLAPVSAGRDQLGDFAPLFAELNDDVLFGRVWARRAELGARDRSVVTVCSLIASGITDSSLAYHLSTARDNGVGRDEIAEIITHAAFYVGWPKAWAAFRLAADIWK
ncbi:carboxymuconolactone decarboxylase family protein [Nanchangia anserum]|uniref:Carboxymuconolactone decarboxylase family protein n=2 Tax=Nanchangia anserum TaxID=2692125 RepID=A0A8I0G8D3_9ACTO|nr:carboxymuconolactone decarboxylase family protein [Nanchangia anserum]QOX82622.1 carboxymuconolactone decarboxylase family protein [Nanchangia anserum]